MKNQFHTKFVSSIVLFLDMGVALCALISSLFLSSSFFVLQTTPQTAAILLALYLATTVAVLCLLKVWHIPWRFVSMGDLIQLTKANLLINLFFGFSVLALGRVWPAVSFFPLLALTVNCFLLEIFMAAPRFLFRYFHERAKSGKKEGDAILVGSVPSIDLFIRYNRTSDVQYNTVGLYLTDKNAQRALQKLHGYEILENLDAVEARISSLKEQGETPTIIISDPKLIGDQLVKLYDVAKSHDVELRRVSDIQPLKSHQLSLRPLNIEDLLGRESVGISHALSQSFIKNKTILITGAGGSIGGEIVRQVAKLGPKKIVLFEVSEYLLYLIDQNLRDLNIEVEWVSIVGNVTNEKDVEEAIQRHKPHIIFHAAALKHVPLSELNVRAAFETNVSGTAYVSDYACKYNVETMILISTDKAVNPSNAMGLSKRVAEALCQQQDLDSKCTTRFVTVRFGNVLGSTGSVVPLFQKQIARGGPITITHEDMERYFMTIEEAVILVLQAGAVGSKKMRYKGGVFVLDMGTPVNIKEMAERMIELSGYEPYKDIKIQVTGIRAGEKLQEELVYATEIVHKNVAESVDFVEPPADQRPQATPLENFLKALRKRGLSDEEILKIGETFV